MIVYMGYQFCQDEKNIEDLKDLANNGLNDLFEYGMEFTTGLALSDGKDKKNSTEAPEEKSFSQKYREQLKKDMDDLDLDEDEMALFADNDNNSTATNSTVMGESEEDADDILDKLMGGDDEEEEVPVGGGSGDL